MSNPPRGQHKETVEVYKELVYIEMRSLISRVAELTNTISDVFKEVTALALQTEEATGKIDQMSASLDYCREEIRKLKQQIVTQQKDDGTAD